ncbi:MAG: PIN domain-containing protein [Nitrospira sp.]|nr:PIN domain-containing protein [bacterium]MBL7048423.1 PIN domain-containing protein [Nitrospira sp.]
MEKNVLVDTCIWIEFFRGSRQVVKKMQPLIEKATARTAGMVLFELFQGVKSTKERGILQDVMKGIPYAEMRQETWMNAAMLSQSIRSKGITLPPSDILLAQIAIENDLEIFTIDEHFKKIPGLKLL